jgi:hypothetical protein
MRQIRPASQGYTDLGRAGLRQLGCLAAPVFSNPADPLVGSWRYPRSTMAVAAI